MNFERPLDFLEAKKGKNVLVKCRDESNLITGIFLAFDIHINIVLLIDKEKRFIRGDSILWIS
jgi:small nuclear ribonucleoprotein (snRNP)-like protein